MNDSMWQDILKGDVSKVEPPKPHPIGTYVAMNKSFSYETSRDKGTPFVRYEVQLISPLEDVDPQAFIDFGGAEKLAQRTMRYDFYMTPEAQYRHKDFFEKTLGMTTQGRGWSELIQEAVGKQFKAHITHRPNQEKTQMYANIDDTARL